MNDKGVNFSQVLLQWDVEGLNYQKITEDILNMCDAKTVLFHLYDQAGQYYTRMASAGANVSVGLKETFDVKESFDMGGTVVIPINKNHTILGKLTIMMPQGEGFNTNDNVTFYTHLLRLALSKNRAEEKLCKCEAMLKETQKLAKLGRWEYFHASNTLIWSDSMFELFEIDKAKFAASYQAFLDTIHPEDRDFVNREWIHSLEKKLPYETTHRLLLNDGRIKWVNEKCETGFDEDGLPIESIGIVQDITERKQSEESIRISHERLQNVIEGTHVGIWEWNVLTRETHFNERCAEIIGYTLDEISLLNNETLLNYAHPEDLKESRAQLNRVFSKQIDHCDVEIRMRHKDGRWIWVQFGGKVQSWTHKGKPLIISGTGTDITERKMVEIALKEKSYQLELALDAGEHGFWDWNMITDQIYFSPTYYTMLGYEPGELPMEVETWANLLHPDDSEQLMSRIMGYLSNAQPYSIEFRLRCKDGRWKWISGRGKFYELDATGKPRRAMGVHVDIDNLMHSKSMVEKERRLLETVLDAVPDILAIQYTDHTINRYNKAGYQFLNMTHQDVQNRKCYELIGRNRECDVCATRKAIETKQLVQLDKYVPEMDIYLECRSNPVIDENGHVIWIIEQMRDITERNKNLERIEYLSFQDSLMSQKLIKSQAEMASILESMTDGFFALDGDLQFTYINRAGERYFGKSRDELLGRKITEAFSINATALQHYHEVMSEKRSVTFEFISETLGNKWLELNIYPTDSGLTTYFRDITSRKITEKEFVRLDRLNLVGQLAAGLGHEIRNPMTTVRGYLQLLGAKPAHIAQQSTFELMISELDRANEIITEFLSLAQTKQTNLKFHNLNDILKNLYPLIEANTFTQNKQITFLPGEIPNLKLNEKEIAQLVLNLSSNGLEAMEERGLLTIKSYVGEGNVTLSIKDEGSGISPENLDKLGTPFFTTKEIGTGLGLAICYKIAESHNASIEINSCSRGTEFLIIFPIPDKGQEQE